MFNKNSGLVKVWVSLIMMGTYKVEQVPRLFNLKEVVTEVMNEMTGDNAEAEVEPKEGQPTEKPADLMEAAQ